MPGAQQAGQQSATADPSTRERVLRRISEAGPVTATALCAELGLTDTAIRRHIDGLLADGLIESRDIRPAGRRRRGRPARGWVVSAAGHAQLTADYDDLATEALRFIEETVGPDAVAQFAQQRIAEVEARYAAVLEQIGDDPRERAEALVRVLSRDGYAATMRPVPGGPGELGLQLCQGHCPVQHVAAEFPQFCEAETEAFSRLLGVHVQRLSTLAQGAHVCTTFVPTGPHPTAPPESTTPSEGRTS
ncbi:MAG: helix-turn-helix domain-containing protein [Tetrasphaera sp.]|nr:helix-turn-helix domain-containing protein [Tetrasphaera sp.]